MSAALDADNGQGERVQAAAASPGQQKHGRGSKQTVRVPALMIVLAMLSVMALEAAVVVGVRAAHLRPADLGVGSGAQVAGFHFSWKGSAQPLPGCSGADVQLASLEIPRSLYQRPAPPPDIDAAMLPLLPGLFDARPAPWLGPDPVDSIVAALMPPAEPFDDRPRPWLGPDPVDTILSGLAPLPAPVDDRHRPLFPAPEPLLEPHMATPEDWITLSRLYGHPGARKVHFNANVEGRCLPSTLLHVLYDAAMRFGDIRVISGYRSPARNRAVGGASRSMHLECRAIDFYAPGAAGGLVNWLIARKDVGGYKRYPFGTYHIDNGPRRS